MRTSRGQGPPQLPGRRAGSGLSCDGTLPQKQPQPDVLLMSRSNVGSDESFSDALQFGQEKDCGVESLLFDDDATAAAAAPCC